MADALSTILETTQAERLATGFGFTEGPCGTPPIVVTISSIYVVTDCTALRLARNRSSTGKYRRRQRHHV